MEEVFRPEKERDWESKGGETQEVTKRGWNTESTHGRWTYQEEGIWKKQNEAIFYGVLSVGIEIFTFTLLIPRDV